jgi:superoxide dismutase
MVSLQHRNDRAKYVEGFWRAVNWDFAAKCFSAVTK